MSLQEWHNNGWIREHTTSSQEIKNLIEIISRDIRDAESNELSPDWRFGIAYNAALKLCTVLLYSKGFRPERNLAHYRTIQSMPLILGNHKKADANYLDACRSRRNTLEYDYAGGTTNADADELILFVKDLQTEVINWLNTNYPDLIKL